MCYETNIINCKEWSDWIAGERTKKRMEEEI